MQSYAYSISNPIKHHNLWMGLLFPGEAKSSDDGEKEGIQIRHGNNEFAPGNINSFLVCYMYTLVFRSFNSSIKCI